MYYVIESRDSKDDPWSTDDLDDVFVLREGGNRFATAAQADAAIPQLHNLGAPCEKAEYRIAVRQRDYYER